MHARTLVVMVASVAAAAAGVSQDVRLISYNILHGKGTDGKEQTKGVGVNFVESQFSPYGNTVFWYNVQRNDLTEAIKASQHKRGKRK